MRAQVGAEPETCVWEGPRYRREAYWGWDRRIEELVRTADKASPVRQSDQVVP